MADYWYLPILFFFVPSLKMTKLCIKLKRYLPDVIGELLDGGFSDDEFKYLESDQHPLSIVKLIPVHPRGLITSLDMTVKA